MYLHLGFIYALSIQIFDYWNRGKMVLVLLTHWCLVIHMLTFFYLICCGRNKKTAKKMLVTSWTLGWTVTIMFWAYVYPMVDLKLLPPVFVYLSTHGGINTLMSFAFLKSEIDVKASDFKWPILVALVYFCGVIVPLKFYGIVVYPQFMDKLVPTLAILLGLLLVMSAGFFCGFYLKSKKSKKN